MAPFDLAEGLASLFPVGPNEPGLAFGLVRDGHVVAIRCAGLASLEHRVPIGPRSRFHIVSVTKTFTAAAALCLAAEGRLDLDADLRAYIPEFPDGPVVTCR